MKVVIYVGREDRNFAVNTPKALIELGDRPILWHIMKYYSSYGHKDFILVCNTRADLVKEFFANYALKCCDVTIDLKEKTVTPLANDIEDWKVTIVDVGKKTSTGGAIKKVQHLIGNEPFMFTYGDGLSDIDIDALISHHVRHKKMITISSITASQKFGIIDFNDNGSVIGFREKDNMESTVNGGFMVINPEAFELIDDDPTTAFEREPMVTAVACKQVTAYKHKGSWRSLDSYYDLDELNHMLETGKAFWKKW